MNPHLAIVPLLLAACASVGLAQSSDPSPSPTPPPCQIDDSDIRYPNHPLTYPKTSDRYAVQYRVGFGEWKDAMVYISYYGRTTASPLNNSSGYTLENSMSFVSIPVHDVSLVQLRVTKLFGTSPGFRVSDNVRVRPSAKWVDVDLERNGTVQLTTLTGWNFAGEQFLLWWGDETEGAAVEGLAFFLDPPYHKPTVGNVKTVRSYTDLTGDDLSQYDALEFDGKVVLGEKGDIAFPVPANINNVYLAPGSWVQGKLRFEQSGEGHVRRIYGPGVLDVSQFRYDLRACGDDDIGFAEQGYHALSWEKLDKPNKQTPDRFILDGIVITDHNHATADKLVDGVVNNVKSIGWNGLNGGFRLGDFTRASNVFLRSGDDSLMMWGRNVTVTNATVWQNYNGAVVNLGWGANSPGDYGLIDGLYVVKTDWLVPPHRNWDTDHLDGQNNAVIASVMVPGTMFGTVKPSVYRNILVEDQPRTLLSLKIVPPECNDGNAPRSGDCTSATLTDASKLNLKIENVFTPPSLVVNSIGFQNVNNEPLKGSMQIDLANVFVKQPNGTFRLLTRENPDLVGGITTNGDNIHIKFNF